MNIPHQYQLFTAAQSRELDRRTIEEFGIDGFTLMEIAGTRAADFILSKIDTQARGLVVCGRGNNAGDALVVARILSEHGINLDILFIDGKDRLSSECSKNLQLLKALEAEHVSLVDIQTTKSITYDFLIDGMLGTGLNSEVKTAYSTAIDWINSLRIPVFSMDIPTGLNADTGEIMGAAVKATYTLAFGTLKPGFYHNHGYDCCGQVIFCELPFPSKFKKSSHFVLDDNWLTKSTIDQKQRAHKYDGGVVYLIAGSQGLTGAAVLASLSAWNTGVGAVVLISPKGLLDIYEKQLVHIIKKPVGSKEDTYFKEDHIEPTLQIISERIGTLLIGPGLGRDESTMAFVRTILSAFKGKCVVDADALFAISSSGDHNGGGSPEWILTPHPGELSLLAGNSSSQSRFDTLVELASNRKNVILSKGLPSIITSPDGSTISTNYDTRIFSRAGFGDVLAGKIAGYLLLTNHAEQACSLALSDGKKKALSHIHDSDLALEPMDVI